MCTGSSLIFISLMTYNVDFRMFIFHFYIFFDEVSVKFVGSFLIRLVVILLLSFKRFLSLFIDLYRFLGNSHLSDVSFPNIFSQSVACLLFPQTLSLAE